MELEQPVVIDAAQDFYDWKAIYRKAKPYDSIQEAVDMAIVSSRDLSIATLTLERTVILLLWVLVCIKKVF